MDHREIRAIRGSLSRAAFASLLGVTSLTVLRWELPDDNKEARRPRARMVESLRRLQEQGVGAKPSASASVASDEDEDESASEPIAAERPLSEPAPSAAFAADEALLQPQLDRLMGESWLAAEDELLHLPSGKELQTPAGRTRATLGFVQ